MSTRTGAANGHRPSGTLRLLDQETFGPKDLDPGNFEPDDFEPDDDFAAEPAPPAAGYHADGERRRGSEHAGRALAETSALYLRTVLPTARAQMSVFAGRARRIPDLALRELALAALAKRGNIEGAALFATLAPASTRAATVRALVAFQTAYNLTDAISEQDSDDPAANADQLHQALLVALHPDAPHCDYYAHSGSTADSDFLISVLESCRRALSVLPNADLIAIPAREAAARILDFQTLNRHQKDGGHSALQGWAGGLTVSSGLRWWETAAAAGSSLSVHALIAAAANRRTCAHDVEAVDAAYFPSVGALHSLLDAVVDRSEDARAGQPSLLDPYETPFDTLAAITALAARSIEACETLPDPARHRAILTAMCSYYLSAPESRDPLGRSLTASLQALLGGPLRTANTLFAARRLANALARQPYL